MAASRDPQADVCMSKIVWVTTYANVTDIAKTLRGDETAKRNLRVKCMRYHFLQLLLPNICAHAQYNLP
jgi:hypothetical protein